MNSVNWLSMYVVCLIFAILALAKETNSYKLLRHRRAAGAITGSTHSVNNNLALSASEFDDDNDMNGAGSGQFTRKQILKEETESPFRAVRYFGYISLGSAAALSSFITLTSIAAVSSGARQGDMNELINNMGINLAGLVTMGYLWNREQKSQNSQLQRISKGGKLAQLKLKCKDPITNESIVCKLSDFRRDRGFEKKVRHFRYIRDMAITLYLYIVVILVNSVSVEWYIGKPSSSSITSYSITSIPHSHNTNNPNSTHR